MIVAQGKRSAALGLPALIRFPLAPARHEQGRGGKGGEGFRARTVLGCTLSPYALQIRIPPELLKCYANPWAPP